MRTRTLAGLMALAVFLMAAPASAEVGVGEEAPSFGAGAYINTEPVELEQLKGRLILLELFSTT